MVSGQVVATASFAGGYKFTLSDGTGQVTLLMWSNVYDNCWDAPTLNLGATVTATGTVGQFEGEWQVEPDFGGDVRVAVAGTLPPIQAIGSLGDHMGQRVTVIGQINRVEGTSSGAKYLSPTRAVKSWSLSGTTP
ncbi:MAG: OB-fold nucleic acid binding domain-containing protein [Chloroflexi bacterium]|nr:OB-fold nucleic acid binding domain-containing protein [Chloroflexota bacterium]